MTIQHTADCLKEQADQAAFDAEHPNYCRKCDAWGVKVYEATREQPEDVEPCGGCTAEGRCPWCGGALIDVYDDDDTDVYRKPTVVGYCCAVCEWDDRTGYGRPDVVCWCEDAEVPA